MNNSRENIVIGLCLVSWIITISMIIYQIVYTVDETSYETVNITNTICHLSIPISNKIYLHECLKSNQKIYDLRKFYLEEDTLKADIIGIQMNRNNFGKICNFCEKVY